MKGFVHCALVAVAALSVACEGSAIRGLQSNETEIPATTATPAAMTPPAMPMATAPVPSKGMGMGLGKGKGYMMAMGNMGSMEAAEKSASSSKSMSKKKGDSIDESTEEDMGDVRAMGGMKAGMKLGSSMSKKGSSMSKKGMGMSEKSSMMKMRMMMMSGKGVPRPPPAPTAPTRPPIGPGETHAPTPSPTDPLPFPELSVTFTLFYTIDQFRLPLPNEFAEVASLTEAHVTPFFESGFDDDELVTYSSSATEILNTAFNFGEPVAISYTSTLVFTQDSFVPRESAVQDLIAAAFSGNSLNTYLGTLTSLPISNLFSTTSQVTLSAGAETRSGGSSFGSNVLIGAGAGASVAALAIAGLVLSGRRRQKERARHKTLGSVGHLTVGGDTTFDSRSINERVEDSRALEEVPLH